MKILRKPDWLKIKLPNTAEFKEVKGILAAQRLHSVCQEAKCPNMTECFHAGTATFLILGDICTRHCKYCNVTHGKPVGLDEDEPVRLVEAVKQLGLQYIVITSVTRDDLPDGGAGIFARCVEGLKAEMPGCRIEVLIPDFAGNWEALDRVIESRPDVINHNVEVVRRLFSQLRPEGDLDLSLDVLQRIRDAGVASKSGFMIGVGEDVEDVHALLKELRSASCERVTIGQYLQPSREHWPVARYYAPEEFQAFGAYARQLGFKHVESGPLVRSSYHAAQAEIS